uniref:Uncharacterized protein n=1 Tax=Cacopsylla melanoneura TaxID=428564 RepID=A0A8D8SSB8_9HEMI
MKFLSAAILVVYFVASVSLQHVPHPTGEFLPNPNYSTPSSNNLTTPDYSTPSSSENTPSPDGIKINPEDILPYFEDFKNDFDSRLNIPDFSFIGFLKNLSKFKKVVMTDLLTVRPTSISVFENPYLRSRKIKASITFETFKIAFEYAIGDTSEYYKKASFSVKENSFDFEMTIIFNEDKADCNIQLNSFKVNQFDIDRVQGFSKAELLEHKDVFETNFKKAAFKFLPTVFEFYHTRICTKNSDIVDRQLQRPY